VVWKDERTAAQTPAGREWRRLPRRARQRAAPPPTMPHAVAAKHVSGSAASGGKGMFAEGRKAGVAAGKQRMLRARRAMVVLPPAF